MTGNLLVDAVERELELQLQRLPRRELAQASLGHSKAVIMTDAHMVAPIINGYGPEHLILQTLDFGTLEEEITNAGSVFLGTWSCESAGDYASGTNHTLPTYGWARSYSGVSLDSFSKKITLPADNAFGIACTRSEIETMAGAESLDAHAAAVADTTIFRRRGFPMSGYKIKELMRPNIVRLVPYASARSDFSGEANVFLDGE
jgi:histidinol dehydrogenase